MAVVGLSNLCTPSYVYLVISIISVILVAVQNLGKTNTYCIGIWECETGSTALVFILKIIYILFWTWVLNLICRNGSEPIAWFLVLLPFILLFVLIVMNMIAVN